MPDSDSNCSVEYPALGDYPALVSQCRPSKADPKKHCCKFCDKLVNKMSAHAQNVHAKEAEVAKILAMEKKKQRKEGCLGTAD